MDVSRKAAVSSLFFFNEGPKLVASDLFLYERKMVWRWHGREGTSKGGVVKSSDGLVVLKRVVPVRVVAVLVVVVGLLVVCMGWVGLIVGVGKAEGARARGRGHGWNR